MKIRALVAAVALSVTTSLQVLGTAAPASADPAPAEAPTGDVEVTFPSVTRFNPDVTDYVVSVVDHAPEAGALYVVNQNQDTFAVPPDGQVPVTFDYNADDTFVWVIRCGYPCVEVARSESLDIYRRVGFDVAHVRNRAPLRPGPVELQVANTEAPAGSELDVAWRIVAPDASVVAEGEQTMPSNAAARLRFEVPEGLDQDATYELVADASLATEDFGLLEGTTSFEFVFDDDANGDVELPESIPTLFPAPDGYRDRLRVVAQLRNGGMRHAFLDVLTPQGKVVKTFGTGGPGNYRGQVVMDWDGRVAGKPVAAGRYQLRVRGEDRAGNQADVRTTFRVSDDKLRWKKWKADLSPAPSQVNSFVGRCSSLKKQRGGGLGLYSQTSCQKPKQSVVVSVHGVYLPPAFGGRYRNMRVSVRGGAARGAREAYLVLGYLTEDGDFLNRAQFDGRSGLHRGGTHKKGDLVRDPASGQPAIYWQVGLSEGSRYDVKRFRVEIQYRTLS